MGGEKKKLSGESKVFLSEWNQSEVLRVPGGRPRGAPPNCDLSPAWSTRMFCNTQHDYSKFDLASFVSNGVPRVRESSGGNITSIGYLQVWYFQPGGVPVESWNSFCLLCNNPWDLSL